MGNIRKDLVKYIRNRNFTTLKEVLSYGLTKDELLDYGVYPCNLTIDDRDNYYKGDQPTYGGIEWLLGYLKEHPEQVSYYSQNVQVAYRNSQWVTVPDDYDGGMGTFYDSYAVTYDDYFDEHESLWGWDDVYGGYEDLQGERYEGLYYTKR